MEFNPSVSRLYPGGLLLVNPDAGGNALRPETARRETSSTACNQAGVSGISLYEGTKRTTGTVPTWSKTAALLGGQVRGLARLSLRGSYCAKCIRPRRDVLSPACRQLVAKIASEAPARVQRRRVARSVESTPDARVPGTSGVGVRVRRAGSHRLQSCAWCPRRAARAGNRLVQEPHSRAPVASCGRISGRCEGSGIGAAPERRPFASTCSSIHSMSSSPSGSRFGFPLFVPRMGEPTLFPFTARLTVSHPSWWSETSSARASPGRSPSRARARKIPRSSGVGRQKLLDTWSVLLREFSLPFSAR